MASHIEGAHISDERTLATMASVYARSGVLVDPHTAVGCAAAFDHLEHSDDRQEQVIVLSTAHPAKFSATVEKATGHVPEMPERLGRCLRLPKIATPMGVRLPELSRFLLDTFR
jgi:threonine synthase